MDVSTCMRKTVVLAEPDCDFVCLLHKIAAPTPRLAYIVDKDRTLIGVVSARDLLKEVMPSYMNAHLARSISDGTDYLKRQAEKARHRCARDIMVKKVISLHPHHQLLQADAIFAERGFNTLPVVDEHNKIVGEVTRVDILVHLIGDPFTYNFDGVVELSE
jgi:CBS-domain-containing membrane protein